MTTTRRMVLVGLGGFVVGAALAVAVVLKTMPGMMIVVRPSRLGFEETVRAVQEGLKEEGWASPGTIDLNASMAKHGVTFGPRVRIVQLCKAPYAKRVLEKHRHLAALMPCAIAVYEGDDGRVYVSKMNTGLMGRLFGGVVAEVMGGLVAREEEAILREVAAE